MTLTVYGVVQSRTLRILWLLEELGLPYTHLPSPPRSDDVTALNDSGKIPVLKDGDEVVTDSTAILTYLSDREGRLTNAPGTIARARQDSLTCMILDEVETPLWTAAKHSFILPEDRRVPDIKPALKWEFAQAVDRLMARKGDAPFLTGDNLTIADIIATHCGIWAMRAAFTTENAAFQDYVTRMMARPALAKASAL